MATGQIKTVTLPSAEGRATPAAPQIARGNVGVVIGAPATGKTSMLLREVVRHIQERNKIIVLTNDLPPRAIPERTNQMLKAREATPRGELRVARIPTGPLSVGKLKEHVHHRCGPFKALPYRVLPDVVVIDTFQPRTPDHLQEGLEALRDWAAEERLYIWVAIQATHLLKNEER